MTKYIELEALKNRFAKRLVWLKKDIHDEYSLGMKCKKSRLLALCISLVLVLAGCTASGQSITPTYPRIEYRNSTYNFDPYNREIPIPEGYVLNEGYSFDIMETDAGCDVVLHFVESEDKTE